jgi:hypothetical protein
MTSEKEEEAFDFFSRLLERMQQTGQDQQGCHINLVYVASGAQHVNTIQHQNNYYGAKRDVGKNERDPYETLLLQIIEPLKEGRNWKAILLPYCAAVVEGVLPLWPHALFVQKTGIAVPSTPYSVWTKGDRFTHDELEPYAERFEQLKRQIDNSK